MGSPSPIEGRCNAKTRDGGYCQTPAMANGRCRMHGGNARRGAAHPRFKHGGRSRYLPAKLAARVAEAEADPTLLELRGDVALIEARLTQLKERLETFESEGGWLTLKDVFAALDKARKDGDALAGQQHYAHLAKLINEGGNEYGLWREILGLLEERRRFVESERRRLFEMDQMIPAERATLMIGVIVGIVTARVQDMDVRQAIAQDIERLVVGRAPQQLPSADDGRTIDVTGDARG